MGYTTNGGRTDFWPDNTENTLYILNSDHMTIASIMEQAHDYFGKQFDPDKINISIEHIHTRAIHYDLHDPSDYDLFYVLTLND